MTYKPVNTNPCKRKHKVRVPMQTPVRTLDEFREIGGVDFMNNIVSMIYLLNTVSSEMSVLLKDTCDKYGIILGDVNKYAVQAQKAMDKYIDMFSEMVLASKKTIPDVYERLNNDIEKLKEFMLSEYGLSEKFTPKKIDKNE